MEEQQTLEIAMSGVEVISLIASIASLILAVGAIWLSIVFFRMSSEAARETTEAAKGIDASVKRLENLFDKLYSDTFSMMKDTVSDMRKHIWSKPASEKTEISEEMKREIQVQVMAALDDKNIPQAHQKEEVAKRIESALEDILGKAKERKRSIKAERLLSVLRDIGPVSLEKLAHTLNVEVNELAIPHIFTLRSQGKITWDGPEDTLTSDSVLHAIESKES